MSVSKSISISGPVLKFKVFLNDNTKKTITQQDSVENAEAVSKEIELKWRDIIDGIDIPKELNSNTGNKRKRSAAVRNNKKRKSKVKKIDEYKSLKTDLRIKSKICDSECIIGSDVNPNAELRDANPEADLRDVNPEAELRDFKSETELKNGNSEADINVNPEAELRGANSEADLGDVNPEANLRDVKSESKITKRKEISSSQNSVLAKLNEFYQIAVLKEKMEFDEVEESDEETCKENEGISGNKIKSATTFQNSSSSDIEVSDSERAVKKENNSTEFLENDELFQCQTNQRLRMESRYKISKDNKSDGLFKCQTCNKCFKLKRYLKQHALTHLKVGQELPEKFKCGICSKIFKMKHHLQRHVHTHTKEYSFTCNHCGKSYVDKNDLGYHLEVHHTKQKCAICGVVFENSVSLKKHQICHEKPKKFTCAICRKVFQKQIYLRNHLRIHSKLGAFECDVCNKNFVQKHALLEHSRIHSGDRPYQCDRCSKSFSTKFNLSRHEKSHEKTKNCFKCMAEFEEESQLKQHLKSCTLYYECVKCGFHTKRKDKLRDHLKRHVKNSDGNESMEDIMDSDNFVVKIYNEE